MGAPHLPSRTAQDSVVEFLRRARSLVVLDNCEHVLDDVAALAAAILVNCPNAGLLATSREGIGIEGEHFYAVRPLATPSDDTSASPAIELFAERAAAADADFEITGANQGSIAAVCRRLDGIPLAIELAAARLRSMSVADIEAHLDERFTLLSSGRRSLKRHQTLAAAIDWSYQLLGDAERMVLGRLAVFAGSFTRDAVEHIASGEDVGPKVAAMVLDQLVEKSLVARDITGTETRYRLLETIREYAIDKLRSVDDEPAVRLAHARYYAHLAEAADATIRGPGEHLAIAAIRIEVDNLRAAFEHVVTVGEIDLAARLACAVEALWHQRLVAGIDDLRQVFELAVDAADTDRAMRLCAALEFFTWTRHTYGVHDWCRQALDLPGADEHPEAARICGLAAIGLIMTGSDMGSIDELARRGIAAERARFVRPSHAPWTALGSVALMTGRVSEGIEAWRTAIERALDAGDPGIVAQIEANLVFALGLDDTHTEEAEALGAQALARARSAGSSSIIAWASAWLELIVFERDRVPPRTLAAEISTTARTTGSDYVVGAFGASIRVSYRHGLAEDALLTAAEYFGHLRRLANMWGVWLHLPIVGLIAADHGRLDIACG